LQAAIPEDRLTLTRARCVPDPEVRRRYLRSLTAKSVTVWPALALVRALAVVAFQAGHEGSIPFARSNPEHQLIGPGLESLVISGVSAKARRATSGPHGCSYAPPSAGPAAPGCSWLQRPPRALAIASSRSCVACFASPTPMAYGHPRLNPAESRRTLAAIGEMAAAGRPKSLALPHWP